MAQGIEWTEDQRVQIIESLQPYLEAGLSRNRACQAIGFDPSTLSRWVKDDEALSIKLRGWENSLNVLAMANVASALKKEAELEDDARKETSKWWLERRMKIEFSPRIENTGADGKDLPAIPITRLADVQRNDSATEDSETRQED